MVSDQQLRITEIFYSLQGEARTVGLPTIFIRLTGCPLRCQYCDTEYAFTGGKVMSFEDIFKTTAGYSSRYVTVTGGEPLAQKSCTALLAQLCDQGYEVSLETSGAMDISQVDERVSRVMDIKTPASGEQPRNRLENIQYLTDHDQVKFVICDRTDYEWSKALLASEGLAEKCEVLFSPSHGQIEPQQLANWILEDQLDVRFQMQLHKLLWNNEPGR